MAEAVSVENPSRELTCSICQMTVSNMVLSSCFHTFCPDCLEGHIRGSKAGYNHYECPICKTKINIDANALKDLEYRADSITPIHYGYDSRGQGGQSYEYCDICSGGKQAVNRCLQCQESFCDSCTNAHVKMKASRYHSQRVVPLRDLAMFEYSDKAETYCPRHRNEKIIVVCRQCGVFLCLVCKLLEHEGHVTRLVSEEANDLRTNLATLLHSQTGFSENLQMKIHSLENNKTQYPQSLDHELTKIRHQTSKLHLQIEKDKTDKERDLAGHYGNHITKNTRSYETLKEDHTNYKILSKQAQELIYTNNDLETIKKGQSIYDKLAKLETNEVEFENERPSRTFVGGDINERQINKMVGHVNETDEVPKHGGRSSRRTPNVTRTADATRDRKSAKENRADTSTPNRTPLSTSESKRPPTNQLEVQPLSEFILPHQDGIGYVYGIAPTNNKAAWMIMLDHSQVMLVDVKGRLINSINIGEPCDGITSDFNGGCYVTCPRSKSVKHIKPSEEEFSTVCVASDQNLHGMSAIRGADDKITLFVCCTAPDSSAYYGIQKGHVRVFTNDKEETDKSFSVQSPVRIDVQEETGYVCVSDHSNGCVIIMEKLGKQVKALYTGEREDGVFQPLGVCFDNSDCVLIADWKGNQILRITKDGELKQTLLKDLDGPQTVAVDKDNLWVGCKLGCVSVYKVQRNA